MLHPSLTHTAFNHDTSYHCFLVTQLTFLDFNKMKVIDVLFSWRIKGGLNDCQVRKIRFCLHHACVWKLTFDCKTIRDQTYQQNVSWERFLPSSPIKSFACNKTNSNYKDCTKHTCFYVHVPSKQEVLIHLVLHVPACTYMDSVAFFLCVCPQVLLRFVCVLASMFCVLSDRALIENSVRGEVVCHNWWFCTMCQPFCPPTLSLWA